MSGCILRFCTLILMGLLLIGCGGGGGGGGGGNSAAVPDPAPANPPPVDPPSSDPPPSGGSGAQGLSIDANLGLVSGGVGRVSGTAPTGVNLVGVSGTGLSVGVSGTGLSIGSIQRFSSVVVNDLAFQTDNADISVQGSPGLQSDLRQGQQVLVIGDLDTAEAEAIIYRANVIGPVVAVTLMDAGLRLGVLDVLGQTIRLNAATVYDGLSIDALAAGMELEVSRIVGADGSITATYIRPVAGLTSFTITGEAGNVTDSAFQINALTIEYDAAQLVAFEDSVLESEDVVEVTFALPQPLPDPLVVTAQSVELLPRLIVSSGPKVDAEGLIEAFESVDSFTLQRQQIATDADTVFFNGSRDDLEEGVRLLVTGEVDETETLVADQVFIESDDSIVAQGVIEDIDLTARTLTILSITFEVRDLTEFDDIEGLADLQVGDRVELVGYVDGVQAVAAEIEREDEAELSAEIRGAVTAFDESNATVDVFGVTLSLADGITVLEDLEGDTITTPQFFASIAIGDFVKVVWDVFSNTDQPADKISLEDD